MAKSIGDYTVKDIKLICEQHDVCAECPIFSKRKGGCILSEIPQKWCIPIKVEPTEDEVQRAEAVRALYPDAARLYHAVDGALWVLTPTVRIALGNCIELFPSIPTSSWVDVEDLLSE